MTLTHIVVSLLSAVAAAFSPDEHAKMIPMVAAVAPDGNVKMIRRAVTVTPNAEIAIADEVEKQFIDKEQVDVIENNNDEADAYTRAHDLVKAELAVKKKELAEAETLKKQVTANLAAKTEELERHKGTYCEGILDCGWKLLTRAAKNLWYDTETRLKSEKEGLKQQKTTSETDVSQLKTEVERLSKIKSDHDVLKGLRQAHASVDEDIASYTGNKTAAQQSHAKIKKQMLKEHKANEDLKMGIIDNMQKTIHSKRDELYSLTATCTRYTKKKTTICNTCSGTHACGDECIAMTTKCHKDPGCSCNDVVGHDLHQEFAKLNKSLYDDVNKFSLVIATASNQSAQADSDLTKIDTDKANADAAYNAEKQRLSDLKVTLDAEKTSAKAAKVAAEQAVKDATNASEAKVAALEEALAAELKDMESNHKKEKDSRTALLLAQEAVMKELLEEHSKLIAGWDSKLVNAGTEKTRLQNEITALKAVIDKR